MGNYKTNNIEYTNNICNITINDSHPYIELSSKINQTNCYGIISEIENQINLGYHKITINSLGEGALWVTNYNGILENGDYISSSPIPGLAMKQFDNNMKNHTLAKITMDCDFNPKLYPLEKIKMECIYTSNMNLITSNMEECLNENGFQIFEIQYDENSNIIYVSDYQIKYIDLIGNTVSNVEYDSNIHYIMAFVGATYQM